MVYLVVMDNVIEFFVDYVDNYQFDCFVPALYALEKMEKHPLKGNASIPMNIATSYQAVGDKVGTGIA
jgi:ureidoglycolate hydrolase